MQIPPILLLGCGRMGAALAAGWIEQGLAPSYAIDPKPQPDLPGLIHVPTAAAVPADFHPAAVILAVKPQMACEALPALAHHTGALFLSIMAGRTLAGLAHLLGDQAALVRAMPNTPAAIRQGITVACAATTVTPTQRALADTLLRAVGQVAWTDDESLLDAVTAVSGGGPAYVFLLAELLEHAAIAQGIPPDLARALARQTVSGAGALLAATATDAADLRHAVTSPKGTTERALAILLDTWPDTMNRAIAAATARSRELAE